MRSFSDEIVSPADLKPIKILIGLTLVDIALDVFEVLNTYFHWL